MDDLVSAILAIIIINPLILAILLWIYLKNKKHDDDDE